MASASKSEMMSAVSAIALHSIQWTGREYSSRGFPHWTMTTLLKSWVTNNCEVVALSDMSRRRPKAVCRRAIKACW